MFHERKSRLLNHMARPLHPHNTLRVVESETLNPTDPLVEMKKEREREREGRGIGSYE